MSVTTYTRHISSISPPLQQRISQSQTEIDWLRSATASDLVDRACAELKLQPLGKKATGSSASELGNMPHSDLVDLFADEFPDGTSTAKELADQIQLCRAFHNPKQAISDIESLVLEKVASFPSGPNSLLVGKNPGDVLDPFILAANFELLSEQSMTKSIEFAASHKALMQIEDLLGHLHENVLGMMRGNFRVPEPQGATRESKEKLDSNFNPFPGADVGQVPIPENPESLRLFQVKSKTGSAKGGDGTRLGQQLKLLQDTYHAQTFYAAVVGTTLKGHRSKGAVLRASPETAVLVGQAALNELTQSATGPELLLRTYQRAFRAAATTSGYKFLEVAAQIATYFETQATNHGEDFLSVLLARSVEGAAADQDSRI